MPCCYQQGLTDIKQMCYNNPEVTIMDEKVENIDTVEEASQEETPAYVPRPAWQVWLARVCLVLFVGLILLYYINMMRGG